MRHLAVQEDLDDVHLQVGLVDEAQDHADELILPLDRVVVCLIDDEASHADRNAVEAK